MPISAGRGLGSVRSVLALTLPIAATWAIAILPAWMEKGTPVLPVQVLQVLFAGLILGIGRQGLDLALVRIVAASFGFLSESVITDYYAGQAPPCAHTLKCVQALIADAVIVVPYVSVLLAIIAIPVTMAWQRSISNPLTLTRLKAFRGWHWVVVAFVIIMSFPIAAILLGVPWAP